MEPLSKHELAQRLVQIRKSKGYSQEELAKALEISRPSLAQIELGNRNIDIFEIQKIDYELALYREAPYSVRNYESDLKY